MNKTKLQIATEKKQRRDEYRQVIVHVANEIYHRVHSGGNNKTTNTKADVAPSANQHHI